MIKQDDNLQAQIAVLYEKDENTRSQIAEVQKGVDEIKSILYEFKKEQIERGEDTRLRVVTLESKMAVVQWTGMTVSGGIIAILLAAFFGLITPVR